MSESINFKYRDLVVLQDPPNIHVPADLRRKYGDKTGMVLQTKMDGYLVDFGDGTPIHVNDYQVKRAIKGP